MESFYGGRQGASFVIKKKFKYLDTNDPSYLVDKPNDTTEVMSEYVINPENKDFWYGEYCIIDTTNKNNPNNGKIYRRTIVENLTGKDDYPNAEYVGQIVGPSSGAAFLKPQAGLLDFGKMRGELVGDWDGLGVKEGTELVTYDPSFKKGETAGTTWPTSVDLKPESVNIKSGLSQGVAGTITKKAPVWNEEHQRYDITTTVAGANWNEDKKKFVNEQEDTPSIRDDIKYNWFNVRKNTENDGGVVESWCYLGFDIPATTFTAEAIHITPGIQPKVVETENSKNHPFWYDFRFEIPGGLRGASVKRIYNNDNGAAYPENSVDQVYAYSFDQLKYIKETDTYCIDPENSDFEFGPMEEKAWFCDIEFMNFNSAKDAVEPTIETKTFFMGYIVEIEHIDLDPETGHVTIIYHNKLQESCDLRYPINVDMNEKTGRVITTYSVGEEQEDGSFVHETKTVDFKYPINVAIDEGNGNVKVIYSLPVDYEEDGTPVVDEEGNIIHQSDEWDFRYPIDINMDIDTGRVITTYSCAKDDLGPAEEIEDFRYPIDINMEPLSGKFTTTYSLIDRKEDGEPVLDENGEYIHETETEYLRYPINIQMIEETGEVVTTYSCAKGENMPAETTHNFRYPIDVHMDTKTGEVTTTYSLIDRKENGDPVLDENGKYIHKTETKYFRYPIDVDWDVDKGDLTVDYSYADPKNEEEKSTHKWELIYPKTIAWKQAKDELVDDTGKKEEIAYFTGQFDIDYTHYDNLTENQKKEYPNSGKFGYMRKVVLSEGEDEKSGTMTFVNTIDEHSQTYDFSYPKQIVFNMDQDKGYYDGSWNIYYYGAEDQHGQFVFPKTLNISKDGVFSYVDSAGKTNEQIEKIVFVDDVFVDSAHQLWIAYTDNTQMENQGIGTGTPLDKNGLPLENGKTYINYGQTIGTLGVMSGPMPSETDNVDITSIDAIVKWYNGTHTNGQLYGKGDVSGKLHIVTTKPIGNADPISAFIMWDPNMGETGAWYKVSEIAGAPVGVPAQIGRTESWSYAENEEMLADGALRFIQLEENEEPLTTSFPWM